MAVKIVKQPAPPKGRLGVPELYALAVGQVIGAGVITLVVPSIKMTGYSAWLAYFAAIVMGFIMISPVMFISSALRLGSGDYSVLAAMSGPKAAGIFSFCYLTQCMSLSLFGTSAAAYLGDVFPILGGTMMRIIIGVSLLVIFYIINLCGIDIMAGAQKLMTWLLIAALLLFTIFGLMQRVLPIFDTNNPQWLTQGWGITFKNGKIVGGFFGATLLFIYSTQGYRMTAAYGASSINARRDIPLAILMTVPTLIVLYCGVAMAGSGVMTIEEYGESTTLTFAAQRIFPAWLYYFFIVGGPIMALLSTLNSSFAYNSILIGHSCDDGWLPVSFGRKNRNGARQWILTYMFCIAIIPIVMGFSITVITNMIQLIGAFLSFLYVSAYIRMPKTYPDAWRKARLHVSDGIYYACCILSFIGYGIVFWKSILSINTHLAIINVSALLILSALGIWRARTGNIVIHTCLWTEEDEIEADKARAATTGIN